MSRYRYDDERDDESSKTETGRVAAVFWAAYIALLIIGAGTAMIFAVIHHASATDYTSMPDIFLMEALALIYLAAAALGGGICYAADRLTQT